MKQTFVFLLLALLYANSAKAQQKISTPIKRLPVSELWTYDYEQEYWKVAIFELQDSSILFSSSFVKEDYYNGNYTVSEILIKDIKLIRTKKPERVSLGLLLGAGIGFSVGALWGWAAEDGPPFAIHAYGGTLALIGAVTGLIIGSVKVSIPINGSMDMYHRNTAKLYKSKITYSTK
jgi:hypothetical protein